MSMQAKKVVQLSPLLQCKFIRFRFNSQKQKKLYIQGDFRKNASLYYR
jgi:hypothetical protein